MKQVTFLTGNKNKIKEIKILLKEDVKQLDVNFDEIQGTCYDIVKDKLNKTKTINGLNGVILVEDTSLHIDCLGGMPGPYIKWFLESKTDIPKMISNFENKKAKEVCYMGYYDFDKLESKIFYKETLGEIVNSTGSSFGYDSIFKPNAFVKTYQQMTTQEKLKISARGKAIEHLKSFFEIKK